jgi:ankyrin repeat protein
MNENSFFLAAQDGNIPNLNNLIEEFGVNINSQNNRDKESALTLAVRYKKNELAIHLINIGININLQNSNKDNAFIIAASTSNDEMLDIFIQLGMDLNFQNLYGDTALIMATHRGFLHIVEKLYNTGAVLNMRNRLGQTALMYAVKLERMNIVEYLIDKGAKLDYQNMWYETVFTVASRNMDKNMLNFLIGTYTKQCISDNFEPLALEESCFNINILKQDTVIQNIISKVKIFILLYTLDDIYMLSQIDIYYFIQILLEEENLF